MNNGLLTSLIYANLLWLPYYFQLIGFESKAAFLSLLYPVAIPVGIVLYNYIANKYPGKEVFLNSFFLISMMAIGAVLCFIPSNRQSIPAFIALLFLYGVAYGGPWSYQYMTEVRIRAEGDRLYYLALVAFLCAYNIFSVVEMVSIGYLIKEGNIVEYHRFKMVVLFSVNH